MERVESLPILKGRGRLVSDIQVPGGIEVYFVLKQSRVLTRYQNGDLDSRKEVAGPRRVLGAISPTYGHMPALTPGQKCMLYFDGQTADLRVDRYTDTLADVRGQIMER